MAKIIRGHADDDVSRVLAQLEAYERDHPGADAEVYRQNSASIRIRIIDDRFAGMPRSSRHREAWRYVESLDEDVQQQVTLLLLLPTPELRSSLMNHEFDHPIESTL